jgi:hypothetical protein
MAMLRLGRASLQPSRPDRSLQVARNTPSQTCGFRANLSDVFNVILQKFFLMILAKSLFLAIHNFCG